MTTILITGGTGLVGNALTKALLSKGYSVIILTRQKDKQSTVPNLSYAHWDIDSMYIDGQIFEQVTHIIHLAGAGVAVCTAGVSVITIGAVSVSEVFEFAQPLIIPVIIIANKTNFLFILFPSF